MGQFAPGNKAYLQILNEEILPASSIGPLSKESLLYIDLYLQPPDIVDAVFQAPENGEYFTV